MHGCTWGGASAHGRVGGCMDGRKDGIWKPPDASDTVQGRVTRTWRSCVRSYTFKISTYVQLNSYSGRHAEWETRGAARSLLLWHSGSAICMSTRLHGACMGRSAWLHMESEIVKQEL